jgi:hypothetical protein
VTLWRPIRLFLRGQRIYFVHVIGLLAPGQEMPLLPAHRIAARTIDNWEPEDVQIMLDEGRRQSDRQVAALEEIRGRAQWLFSFGTPLAAVIAAILAGIGTDDSGWWIVAWAVAFAGFTYGVLGAAAIIAVRADLETIDTAVLSSYQPPIAAALAADYSSMLQLGENTVATRLTLFRQAVVWVILGGYGALIVWLATR